MSSSSSARLALLAAVTVPVATASAATFVFDGTEGVTSYSKTVSGITLSLSNPVESGTGNVFAFGILGVTGNHDLSLGFPLVTAFDFQFSQAVTITGYNVGFVSTAGPSTFTLTSSGSTTSSGNSLASVGDHTISPGFVIAANHTGTFTTSIPPGASIALHSITVTAAVPEPAEWTSLAAAACGGAALLLRRRRKAE